jgi:Tol biopolymer transport system component
VPQPMHMTTLTRMEGAQYQPSWSADGRNLAFIASGPGDRGSAIYIQAAGDMKPRQLIAGYGDYSSPSWSPDGKSLAFIHTQPDTAELVILSLASSPPRQLTTLFLHRYSLNYRHLDWSPDGDFLAVDDKAVETDPLSLYLVHISDGKKIRLTYPNMDMIGDVAPRFSPDGTRVAFIRLKYQFENDVFVSPVTGGESRRLTDQSHLLGDVDWQSNDNLIFSGRLDDKFRFWQLDLRSPAPSAMLASAVGTDLPTQFSIVRASGWLAYSAFAPDLNIWSLDLTQRPGAPPAWNTVIQTPGEDIEPSFSPNGTRVAFRSDQSGKIELWVSNRDGSQASPIDTQNLTPSVYCWERDGKALIFASPATIGLFEVSQSPPYRLRRITALPYSHPALSVDGKSVFAIQGNFVYRVAVADGAAQKVSDQGGAPIVQSKDGRYLYFARGRMDPTISRLDLETGNQTVVVSSIFPGYSDSWALTQKGILFLKMESGHLLIKLHDLTTQNEITVAEFAGSLPPVGLSGFAISPDERTLFVVRGDPISANIQAIDVPLATKHEPR